MESIMDETTTVVAHAEFPKHYGSDPVRFSGHPDALLERHLLFNDLIDPRFAGARQTFEAAARSVRDVLSKRWSLTSGTYHRENPKRIYYLSMEFLIGRSLTNNITNLMLAAMSKARRARPTSTGSGCSSRNPMPASATAV
jgi:starch phosphorylase